MFEEEEEVGGDSSLGSSNSRSRGHPFRKKVPKTSLLHHLRQVRQQEPDHGLHRSGGQNLLRFTTMFEGDVE